MIGVKVGDATCDLHCDALTVVYPTCWAIILRDRRAGLLVDAAEVEGVDAVVALDEAVAAQTGL